MSLVYRRNDPPVKKTDYKSNVSNLSDVDTFVSDWINHPASRQRATNMYGTSGEQMINDGIKNLGSARVIDDNYDGNYLDFAYESLKDGHSLPFGEVRKLESNDIAKEFGYAMPIDNYVRTDLTDRDARTDQSLAHEETHLVTDLDDRIREDFHPMNTSEHNKNIPQYSKEYIERGYAMPFTKYSMDDGIWPKMMEIRRGLNMSPDEEFTQEHLDRALQDDNLQSAYEGLKDMYPNKGLIELFNKVVSNDIPVNKAVQMARRGGILYKRIRI